MKRLIAIILMLALVFTMAACGGGETTPSTEPGGETNAGGSTSQRPNSPKAREIVIWSSWSGKGGEALDAFAESFNEAQDDYVATVVYSGSYQDILAKYQATAIGSRPDIVMTSTENVAFFADNPDYFISVQQYIDAENYDISDLMPNLRVSYSDKDGNLMCIPFGNTVVGFFYNEKLLEEAGIDPLTDLNSYEELAEACHKLKANGVQTPFYIAANSIYYTFPITAEGLQYVDQNNGMDGLCTQTTLMSDDAVHAATVKYFEILQDLQTRGELASIDMKVVDARQAFVNGEIAFLCGTCSNQTTIANLGGEGFEFGFHVSPTITKGAVNHGQCTGGGVMFVANNNNPEQQQGAWEFMKHIMLPENSAAFAMATGYLPITQSGFESDAYQEFVTNEFPTAVYAYEAQKNTEETCFNAMLPMFSSFHQVVVDYTKKAINQAGSYSAEQATADMAAGLDECIDLYALSKG